MKIYPEQLAKQLPKLAHCYLLFGDEPLFISDAISVISQAAEQQGFAALERFEIDAQTASNALIVELSTASLFAERRCVLLRAEKLADLKWLNTAPLHNNPDLLLLVSGPKPSGSEQKSQWFTQLTQLGVYVVCNTPDRSRLPNWFNQQLSQLGFSVERDAMSFLLRCYEGNLLAANQGLAKLAISFPQGGVLTLSQLEQTLDNAAHFSLFALTDACLQGQPKRALRILEQLAQAGTADVLLCWSLQKEVQLLYQLAHSSAAQQIYQRQRIWPARQQLLQQALQRLDKNTLSELVLELAQHEIAVKSSQGLDVVQRFAPLVLRLSQG